MRPVELEDALGLVALRSNAAVNKFLARSPMTTTEEVCVFIGQLLDGMRQEKAAYWVMTPPGEGRVIGAICLLNLSTEDARAEVGFELHPEFQGKGLMQEALREVLGIAFANRFRVVEGWVHKDNTSSLKLLQKAGFSRDFEAEARNRGNEDLDTMVIYSGHAPTQAESA